MSEFDIGSFGKAGSIGDAFQDNDVSQAEWSAIFGVDNVSELANMDLDSSALTEIFLQLADEMGIEPEDVPELVEQMLDGKNTISAEDLFAFFDGDRSE
jgi:acyl carrier protein